MCNIEEARWNGVKILIPKHIRKSKNELLEQISAKNPYVTFFLGHPVHGQVFNIQQLNKIESVNDSNDPLTIDQGGWK